MRAELPRALRLAAALATALCIASAQAVPRAYALPDLSWPAQADAAIDSSWISERSTGVAKLYQHDFALALPLRSDFVAKYDTPDALPTPPARGVLLRVQVDADGRMRGSRVFRSSGDAGYDELVVRSLESQKPVVAPPAALLQGRPSLYLIGMFALGFSQKEDSTGPIWSNAFMATFRSDRKTEAAFTTSVLDAVRRDFDANVATPDKPLDIVLQYTLLERGSPSVEIARESGDAALDRLVLARARAAIAPIVPPDHLGPIRWSTRFHFGPIADPAASRPAH